MSIPPSSHDSDAAISTSELSKSFGSITALDRLTLSVPRGTIYGFLGPNGAGKTTAIKLLMGFINPTSGSARIYGVDASRRDGAARRELGYLVPADHLYPDMTGAAHLAYATRLNRRAPSLRRWLLDVLELSAEALRRPLRSYSKGMRQKLALIAAMQHDPALLILDEPTDGLDPLVQRNFEGVLSELRARGRTVFMSSHDLPEVERLCDRVAVVRAGKLVAEETVLGLQRVHRRRAIVKFRDEPPPLDGIPGVTIVERDGHQITLLVEHDVNQLLRHLADVELDDLVLGPPSLDDIFLDFYEQPVSAGRIAT